MKILGYDKLVLKLQEELEYHVRVTSEMETRTMVNVRSGSD